MSALLAWKCAILAGRDSATQFCKTRKFATQTGMLDRITGDIDSMTMSAPGPRVEWWCKANHRLGRKEPSDDHYRSRFPSRVSTDRRSRYALRVSCWRSGWRIGMRPSSSTARWQPAGQVRVGMEASGHARWFQRLLGELQVELWIGDAAADTGETRT